MNLIGGTLLIAAHDWAGVGGPLYAAVVLAAGIACLLKARESRKERGAWLAITAAIFSSAITDTYWAVLAGRGCRASKRSGEALTAADEGYELGPPGEPPPVPEEAAIPAEAMKLADVRMYAQKQSRQLAFGPTVVAGDPARLRAARDGEAVEQRA